MAHNYVTFFRFNERYEDVFIEDDHFLYACAEPFGWHYLMACNVYRDCGNGIDWIREDTVGADTVYLDGLERADEETALAIIAMERRRWERIMAHLDGTEDSE